MQDHDPDGPRSLTQRHADVIARARHVEALGYDTFGWPGTTSTWTERRPSRKSSRSAMLDSHSAPL
ncbi:protein of unknown function [Ralstonia solanacearum CMR15]|nr:protein of unknown function [Ralstonia solanacearum CMR15]